MALHLHIHDAFEENKHPRGQPENKGQFASTSGGGGSSEHEFARNDYVKTSRGAGFTIRKVEGGRAYPQTGRSVPLSELTFVRATTKFPEQGGTPKQTPTQAPKTTFDLPKAEADKVAPLPPKAEVAETKPVENKTTSTPIKVLGGGSDKQQYQNALTNHNFPGLDKIKNLVVVASAKQLAAKSEAAKSIQASRANGITRMDEFGTTILMSPEAGRDRISIMTHEIGHAVDHNSGTALSATWQMTSPTTLPGCQSLSSTWHATTKLTSAKALPSYTAWHFRPIRRARSVWAKSGPSTSLQNRLPRSEP